jgi:hypothetical protein
MGENSVNVGGLGCTVGFFSALRFGFLRLVDVWWHHSVPATRTPGKKSFENFRVRIAKWGSV